MWLLDKLFHKKPTDWKFAPMLNGYSPIFTQIGTDIYASDVVQQALKCIVDEIKKLNPTHIKLVNSDPQPVRSTVQEVFDKPNPLMTTSELLEKITWLLLLNYNAFIVQVYRTDAQGRRYYEALYPIQPTVVNFIEDASGRLFVNFQFRNAYETTIPYDDVIHLKWKYSINDYMGGNQQGQPDNLPLLQTLKLNEQLLQGVAKAMNASYQINGVVKYNTLLDDGNTEKALAELERKLMNSESGFLPLDLKAEFIPLQRKTEIVDANTIKFIDEKILRNFGVPLDIVRGDFSQETYNAFYSKTLEPLIISMSQAFTKKMFTDAELARGHAIKLYPKELIFMTVEQTLKMIEMLSPTGGLYENEKRAALGLRPLPELEGKRYMSLNWIDADNAAQYQTGEKNVNVDIVDEEKEEL